MEHDKRSATTAEIEQFMKAAETRPTIKVRATNNLDLKERLNKRDPFRMILVRRHNKWLRKRCDEWGIPYEEVPWWDL